MAEEDKLALEIRAEYKEAEAIVDGNIKAENKLWPEKLKPWSLKTI